MRYRPEAVGARPGAMDLGPRAGGWMLDSDARRHSHRWSFKRIGKTLRWKPLAGRKFPRASRGFTCRGPIAPDSTRACPQTIQRVYERADDDSSRSKALRELDRARGQGGETSACAFEDGNQGTYRGINHYSSPSSPRLIEVRQAHAG